MFKNKVDYKISLVIFVSVFCVNLLAQKWDIPAEKSARNSYIPFTDATVKQGEEIYTRNCQSCHGDPGKGNGLKTLVPVPPDMTRAETQQRTDGDLFYILIVGRQMMPAFGNILSEEQRWKLISYIRSFNKKYVQVLSKFDPQKSKLVKISLDFDARTHKLRVQVKANEKTGIVALKNDEVMLSVNRYFGSMQGKTLRTNNEGVVIFDFPKDLPGDKKGIVDLVVKVSDDNYGEIESPHKLRIGIPTDIPSLTHERAMWNTTWKAPIWLMIVYTSCVLVVLSCFGYIFYNLFKIKKAGNK